MVGAAKYIQKYKITQKIEESNYAIIYKVEDPKGKPVVLKVAREKKDEYNELISREFQILAQFKHPNIVPVFDYDMTDDGRAYFILEYITGKSINKCFKDFSEDFRYGWGMRELFKLKLLCDLMTNDLCMRSIECN
jgi:serine/threonine protein kinase